MKVEKLMVTQVHTCAPENTLAQAARLMWDCDCGWLPVCEGNGVTRVVGAITDRDITMCALFRNQSLSELRVADAMTRDVKTVGPRATLAEAERIMCEAQIRRLPVTDEQGALLGVITLADLARRAADEQTSPKQKVTSDEVGVTLASICKPPEQVQPQA